MTDEPQFPRWDVAPLSPQDHERLRASMQHKVAAHVARRVAQRRAAGACAALLLIGLGLWNHFERAPASSLATLRDLLQHDIEQHEAMTYRIEEHVADSSGTEGVHEITCRL